MKEISIGQAQKISSPNPFALLSSHSADGKNNLMAVSWWTYVSNSPATLAVCISQKGFTHHNLDDTGDFALCLPGEKLKDAAFRCGTCSGRDTDKAAAFGIGLSDASAIDSKLVSGCAVVFECTVKSSYIVGDHIMYIAEAAAIHGDDSVTPLFAMNGYGCLDTAGL